MRRFLAAVVVFLVGFLPGVQASAMPDGGVGVTLRTGYMQYQTLWYSDHRAAEDAVEKFLRDGREATLAVKVEPYGEGSDPLQGRQWALQAIGVPDEGASADGSGVTVAVIDNGVAEHADLTGMVVGRRDFSDGKSTLGHGTAVAGIIGARAGNSEGGRGVAPGVKLLDVRVCGRTSCEEADVANGVVWAVRNGADVLNLSLGTPFYSAAMSESIAWAIQKGVTVVVAAGNTACQAKLNNGGNANCLRESRSMNSLARVSGVVAVAAIDSNGERASYSSYGWETTLGAPTGVLAPDSYQYAVFSGTSAAAPHASGAAALVLQQNPGLSGREVAAVLQSTTAEYGTDLRAGTWVSCGEYNPADMSWDGCEGYSEQAIPQRELGGTGFLRVDRAVEAAKASLTWSGDLKVESAGSSLTVRDEGSAEEYVFYLDGREVARGPESVQVLSTAGFGSRVAVQVARVSDGAEKSRSRIQLVDTAEATKRVPEVLLATDSRVVVKSPVEQNADAGLVIENESGEYVAGCAGYRGETTYWCGWEPVAGAKYRARYMGLNGTTGPASSVFEAIDTRSPYRAESSVEGVDGGFVVSLRKQSQYARWEVGGYNTRYSVGIDGVVLDQTNGDTTCEDQGDIVTCRSASENGQPVAPWVYAVRTDGSNSRVEYLQRVVPEKHVDEPSNVRVQESGVDSIRVRFDGGTEWVGDGMHVHNVHSSSGVAVGAMHDDGGWYADIPVDRWTPETLKVTVVAGEWVRTSTGGWWLTLSAGVTKVVEVPKLVAPVLGACRASVVGVVCEVDERTTSPSETLIEWKITRSGEVLDHGFSSSGGAVDTRIAAAGAPVEFSARTVSERTNGRASEWVTTTFEPTSDAPRNPESAAPENQVQLPGETPSAQTPEAVAEDGSGLSRDAAREEQRVKVTASARVKNGGAVLTVLNRSAGSTVRVYENGRKIQEHRGRVVSLLKMKPGRHTLVVRTTDRYGEKVSLRVVVRIPAR